MRLKPESYCKIRDQTTLKDASTALEKIRHDLEKINMSAANSLLEGLDETLTLHELGLSVELTRSLGTTNCIESFMSQVGAYTDKVDRWRNSSQIQRWVATSALDIEPRLHKIRGHRYLKVLRFKLTEKVAERLGQKTGRESQLVAA